jgi:hypothetical protein
MATAKNVKPTKKNSPAVHTGKAKFNKPADTYANPHTNKEKKITGQEVMDRGTYAREKAAKDVTVNDPIKGGVSFGTSVEKTDGIEMRGAGAATKGRMSRGPMA